MNHEKYRHLSLSLDAGVLLLRLNRPDHNNLVHGAMHTEIASVFADIARDRAVRAVVLAGQGRDFSSGGDLEWFSRLVRADVERVFGEARKMVIDLLELPQPIVAAVQGTAVGLGATLALFCDVVYAARCATIGDPHVRIGLTAGDGGAAIWPLLLGPARAKQYLMTGDLLSGTEAARIGLVNAAVPPDELLPQAIALARRLASGATQAIAGTKASVNKPLRQAVNLVLDTSLALEKQNMLDGTHLAPIAAVLARQRLRTPGR